MANAYIGSDDFRGFLAARASGPGGMDANAQTALQIGVGNDGRYDPNKLNSFYDSPTGDRSAERNALDSWTLNEYNNWLAGRQQNTDVLGANTNTPSNTTNKTSSTTSGSQQDVDYLNSQESLYNRLLQSINSAKTTGIDKLIQSEKAAKDKATLENERRVQDFNTQRTDSDLAKQRALGTVDTNARTLSDSMRRIIGMAAGSGASANLAANSAIARQASQNRGNVMTSYGQNERDLDTTISRNETDFDAILQDIANQRKDKEKEFNAGITTGEQGIQQSLGEIAGERERLRNGNVLSAMKPYQDRYFALQDTLDSLDKNYAPTFTPRAGTVQAPQLRDYLVDRQAVNATRQSGQQQYSPYSAFLQRKEEDKLA